MGREAGPSGRRERFRSERAGSRATESIPAFGKALPFAGRRRNEGLGFVDFAGGSLQSCMAVGGATRGARRKHAVREIALARSCTRRPPARWHLLPRKRTSGRKLRGGCLRLAVRPSRKRRPGQRRQRPGQPDATAGANGLRPGIAGEFRPCRGRDRTSCRVAEVGRRRPGPEKRGVGVTTGPRDRGPGPQRETAAVEAGVESRTATSRKEARLDRRRLREGAPADGRRLGSGKPRHPSRGARWKRPWPSQPSDRSESAVARNQARRRRRQRFGRLREPSGKKTPRTVPETVRLSGIVVVNVDLSCLRRAKARGQVGSRTGLAGARKRAVGGRSWSIASLIASREKPQGNPRHAT